MTEQPSSSPFAISPMWKMYTESLEVWEKTYESLLKGALPRTEAGGTSENQIPNGSPLKAGADGIGEKPGANRTVPSYDAALLHWQRSGEELFKCVIQNQIELCEFFRDRWAQYLKLPEQLSQCRSVTDLGRLQSAFLNEFAHEVMNETEKLAQPVAELARRAVRLAPPHQ